MNTPANHTLSWREALRAIRSSWRPLVGYEVVVSLLTATLFAPLLVAASYWFIGLSGEAAAGNLELLEILLSPSGAAAALLGISFLLTLVFVEFAGLIVIADAAFRNQRLSVAQIAARMLSAAPRLFGLALLQASLALLAALPFAGLAGAAYWLLLSDADINYFLSERPPRFWAAVAIGSLIALAAGIAAAWFFVRWALAVPACVLDGQNWISALRTSARLMRGRAPRLLAIFVGWQLLRHFTVLAAIAGLDRINTSLLASFQERLSLLIWTTVGLLLLDALTLQLLSALFAVGIGVALAREYELARRALTGPGAAAVAADQATAAATLGPAWRMRIVVVAIVLIAPAVSILSALAVVRDVVEFRPARVTAHRAGYTTEPENSIAALRQSMQDGADYVEIDVQQTADGHVVLLHDRDLRRVTGDPRNLADVTLAELQKLRLRGRGGVTDEPVPTLAEFLAACDSRMRLNVELKYYGANPRLAPATIDVLREHGFLDRAVVSCLQLSPLRQVQELEPSLPVGIILTATQGDVTRLRVDFLSLNQRLVRGSLVRRAHQRGMEVHVWSVGGRDTALRLLDLGCDNLIVDDAAPFRELVDWYADRGAPERMLLRLRRWMRE